MVPLHELNPQQRAAAEAIDGPVLVLSGAGTGKTRTVAYRVAHMLDRGIKPEHILAVTFTNKAAREMAERVRQLAGKVAKQMQISTFHRLGLRLVRENTEVLGLRPHFSIYDASDQLSIVKKALRAVSVTWKQFKPEDILFRMQSARTVEGRVVPSGIDAVDDAVIHSVWDFYHHALRAGNAVDFEDLLLMPLQLFRTKRSVLDDYRRLFTHLIVDEYQDTNAHQFELIKSLASKHRNLCVVGDDDQSIYGWRGAEVRNILDFEKHFHGAVVVRLEENYRSTSVILDAANAVIHKNVARKEKKLWTRRRGGVPIRCLVAPDDVTEAELVVADIISHQSAGKHPFDAYAILMRMNTQSRPFEDVLRRYRIPYTVVGGMQFYDRKEVKDYLSYLRLVANPQDEEALLRIVNVPARGVGETTVSKLIEHAAHLKIGLFDALAHIESNTDVQHAAAKNLLEFHALVSAARARAAIVPASVAAREMWDAIGYRRELESMCRSSDDVNDRMANIDSLLDGIAHFEKQSPGATIDDYLRQIALFNDDEEELKNGRLVVMTIHSSKGLEFPYVYLVGVEHGVMPHTKSVATDTGMAEERRLFYVAITRARDTLVISYPQARMRYGKIEPRLPSEFLDDIPPHLIEWDREAGTKEASKEQAASFLEQLKRNVGASK